MTKDELIQEHLGRCTENNLFKASVEHWLNTGKASGSFRAFLHAMMDDHAKAQLSSKEQECESLNLYNQGLTEDRDKLRAENERLKIDASHHAYNCDMAKRERDKAENENISLRKRCEDLEAALNKVLRTDQAWPLIDIVKKLASGTDVLLHQKDYDALGWEEYEHSLTRAKDWIKSHDEILKLLSQ